MSGAFQLMATSFEVKSAESSTQSVAGSSVRSLFEGPPTSNPGHGGSMPSATEGRWCGLFGGSSPTPVRNERP